MTRPWKSLDKVTTAEGVLELRQRGDSDFLIVIDGRVLMNSHARRSEEEMSRLGCAHLVKATAPRVLIAGLGMGFTLRAALDVLPRSARVVVCELNPVVVQWCRGPLAQATRNALDDPRVELKIEDVAAVISRAVQGSSAPAPGSAAAQMASAAPGAAAVRGSSAPTPSSATAQRASAPGSSAPSAAPGSAAAPGAAAAPSASAPGSAAAPSSMEPAGSYDAILLDLYEGPNAASQRRDDPFYGAAALDQQRRALSPTGVLSVWSEDTDAPYARRATAAGFDVEATSIGAGGRKHVVYICRPARAARRR